MKLLRFFFFLFTFIFLSFPQHVLAIENPLTTQNNKMGIHIFFPSEIENAAKLINSNGGDWGYVIIPIQSGDKDIVKWQQFMNDAKRLHVIPLMRIATEGDYFNTKVWRKPNLTDVLDFANFLNSLQWPTQNRYIVVFNEVNRADEWGGSANPSEYAAILSYAVTAFKSKNPDFFIITAGLDNAAASTGTTYNQYDFIQGMQQAIPGIFNQVDGLGSHSYPNPAFSQPPSVLTSQSISSFIYERRLIQSMSSKSFPIFITETGWPRSDSITDAMVGSYLQTAFQTVWNDPQVVAVTPFLLQAGAGPFVSFSFLKDNTPTLAYVSMLQMKKVAGSPHVTTSVLGSETKALKQFPPTNFPSPVDKSPRVLQTTAQGIKTLFKWFLHI